MLAANTLPPSKKKKELEGKIVQVREMKDLGVYHHPFDTRERRQAAVIKETRDVINVAGV